MTYKPRTLAASAAVILLSAAPLMAAGTASDGDGEQMNEAKAVTSVSVTAMQAGDAALKAAPGTISEIGFDEMTSGPVWNVTVVDGSGNETLVMVDAGSGKVTSQKAEGETADGQGEQHGEQGEAQDGGQQGENGEDAD